MKVRLPIMALLVVALAAFGCGESEDTTSVDSSTSAPGTSNAESVAGDSAPSDDASADFAQSPERPQAFGADESADSAGAPGPQPSAPPSPGRAEGGQSADSAAGGAEAPGFAAEAEAGAADGDEAEPTPDEEMVEETQWIQLSTDDSTSMASAQLYKSGQFLRGGLKVHEFINYYDPPHSLFGEEEFAQTRDIDESIRFGIEADYVAAPEQPATEGEEEVPEEVPTEPVAEDEPVDDGEEPIDGDVPVEIDEEEPVVEPAEQPEAAVFGELEVLFQMQSDPTVKEDRRNWNLFLCVDVSGSMRGEKMEFTIEALLKMLDHLKAGDRLTLTTFSNEATNIFVDLEFGESQGEIRSAISELTPGGGTNMTEGLQQSYRLAQQNFDVNMLQRVLLFGDGAANVGQTDLETFTSLTRINGSEGIYLSGIGVGTNYDFTRMDQLTDAGKGAHIFLPNRQEVDLIFGDYFPKLVEVAADGIEIEASLPTGITLAAFSGEEVSFNPEERLQNIVLATGDDMTFTAKFNVLDEAALDEPMSLKVTIRPLSTDEKVIEIIEVDSIRDLITAPGRLFERTRLVHRFGTYASNGGEDLEALRADLESYADPDWGIREILTLLSR